MTHRKRITALLSAAMAALLLLSGCATGSPTVAPTQAPAATATVEPTAAPEPTQKPDPIGRYPETLELTQCTVFAGWMSLLPGEDQDNNWWTKLYLDKLNIKLTCKWAASEWGGDFDQKFNQSLASDDLPDMIYAYTSNAMKCIKNDKVVDLTEVYNNYASDQLKAIYAADENALKAWTIDGKMSAISTRVRQLGGIKGFWIRKDWLDKLNLPVPKTIAEVENVAREFIKQNPGGAKANYGIALAWDSPFFDDAQPYFNLKTGGWCDVGGKLVDVRLQSGMTAMWQKAADWYAEGILPKDFAVKKDDPDIRQDIVNEKAGIFWGYASDTDATTIKDLVTRNGNADFVWVRPLTIDGQKPQYVFDAVYGDVAMVNKKCKNPEALIKMLNLGASIFNEPKPDFITDLSYRQGDASGTGWAEFWRCVCMYCPEDPSIEITYRQQARDAFAKKDPSNLGLTAKKKYYDAFVSWTENRKSDPAWLSNWGTYFYCGPEGTLNEVDKIMLDKKDYTYSPWWGPDTDAMTKNGENWHQKYEEYRTNAILKNEAQAQFDAWVAFYKANGGDQASQEVNDWYATHK